MYQKKINAYLISAYRDPKALKRLVDALNDEINVDFYIHIDGKVEISVYERELSNYSNVFFLTKKERIEVYWGGYSQVKMQYNLIKKMLSTRRRYCRVFILTEADYPLVSNETLQKSLLDGKEYIIGYDVSHEKDLNSKKGSMKDKFLFYHFMDSAGNCIASYLNKLRIKKKSSYEKLGYDFYFGSEYWILSYECIREIFYKYSKDKKLQNILQFSFAPSEAWIHTTFFNSKWKEQGEIFNSRYEGLISLSPVHYFEYHNRIRVLTKRDYEKVMYSQKLFCRKVQSRVSDSLIRMIEEER